MTFWLPQAEAVLAQICELLQRQGRVSYWALQRRFDRSDNDLKGLKVELIEVQDLATDQDGKMLVWTGGARMAPAPVAPAGKILGVVGGHEPELAVAAPGQACRSPRPAGADYGWFTEGFDTADLQEARALLVELSC
jgi:hypothetical protein